jgi:hypothetical protein
MSDYPRNTGARSRGLQAFKDSCRLRHTLNVNPSEVISATITRRFLLRFVEPRANGDRLRLRACAGIGKVRDQKPTAVPLGLHGHHQSSGRAPSHYALGYVATPITTPTTNTYRVSSEMPEKLKAKTAQ